MMYDEKNENNGFKYQALVIASSSFLKSVTLESFYSERGVDLPNFLY